MAEGSVLSTRRALCFVRALDVQDILIFGMQPGGVQAGTEQEPDGVDGVDGVDGEEEGSGSGSFRQRVV